MALLRSLPTTCELPRQHPCRCLAMGVGGEILAPSQRETLRCGSPRAQKAQLPTPRIAPRCLTSGHSLRPVGRRSVPRFAGAFASWLNGSKKWYRSVGCSALGLLAPFGAAAELMQYARNAQREFRDDPLELRPILRDHLIRPAHRADRRFELTTARVFIFLAGAE